MSSSNEVEGEGTPVRGTGSVASSGQGVELSQLDRMGFQRDTGHASEGSIAEDGERFFCGNKSHTPKPGCRFGCLVVGGLLFGQCATACMPLSFVASFDPWPSLILTQFVAQCP